MGEYYILPQERVRKKRVNPKWRRRRFRRAAFSIGILVVLIGLGAALAGSRRWLPGRRSATVDPATVARALVLGNLRLNQVQNRWQASGTVVNNSRHIQRDVELSLTITNNTGGATETPTVRKEELAPGEVWQFSVDLQEPHAASIRLRRLTSAPEQTKSASSL